MKPHPEIESDILTHIEGMVGKLFGIFSQACFEAVSFDFMGIRHKKKPPGGIPPGD